MVKKRGKYTMKKRTHKGITYVEGVNIGYQVKIGTLVIPNVGFRSLHDVKRDLIKQGYRPEDIKTEKFVSARK